MIINVSRAKTWFSCRRKAFNNSVRNLEPPGGRSMNLVDGSAVHAGVAHGMATHNWNDAERVARELYDKDVQVSTILPEETYLIDAHWAVISKILQVYRSGYEQEQYQILQPECEFITPLEDSHHNCINLHWQDSLHLDHWTVPTAQDIEQGIFSPHAGDDQQTREACKCWTPHYLTGKTDAIVKWQGNIWLLEHKTTSISGQQFWGQWQLDIQPTAYIYGIWKALGIRPRGFVLNALIKPSEAQVAGWNKRRKDPTTAQSVTDYIKFEREAFLRGEEDLHRVSRQLRGVCNDWERAMIAGPEDGFYMSPVSGACTAYNRLCDYHASCLDHERSLNDLSVKTDDYVQLKQKGILDGTTKV